MFENLRQHLEGKQFLTNKEEIIAHLQVLLKKVIQRQEKVLWVTNGG